MYCLYVGFDYTYIDVNALAQGIKSFLASHVWSQAVAEGSNLWHRFALQLLVSHANHSATESSICMYVCMYVCMYACICVCVCIYVLMYDYIYVLFVCRG